jgi:hypothetical protein
MNQSEAGLTQGWRSSTRICVSPNPRLSKSTAKCEIRERESLFAFLACFAGPSVFYVGMVFEPPCFSRSSLPFTLVRRGFRASLRRVMELTPLWQVLGMPAPCWQVMAACRRTPNRARLGNRHRRPSGRSPTGPWTNAPISWQAKLTKRPPARLGGFEGVPLRKCLQINVRTL